MNNNGTLNAETQRKSPQGKILQPKLRFKGFADPWQQRKLGEVINEYVDFAVNEINLPVATSSRSGLHLQSDYFDGGHTGIDSSLTFRRVPEGYITYRHMSDDSIFHFNENRLGRTVLVSKEYPVFSCTTLIDQSFLLNVLNYSADFRAFAIRQKKGGTRTRLYFSVLQNFIVSLPTIAEQARIGEFFRVLDDLIAAAKKKADLLKLKKRYYLQAIFSQQLRFKGFTEPWQQRKLGELLSVRKETTTTPTLYHIDIELENLQEDGGLVGDATVRTNSTSVFRRGDVLFGRLRPYLRKWWLATESGIRSGEIWAIYSPSRVLISSFVYALVQSPIFLQVALITSGTKMPRSDWENIASEAGSLPCSNDEQARIGNFFNKLDNLIAASCRKIELLERCKDAYLQLLFI